MKAKEFFEGQMNQITRFLFNFNMAYLYTFIAGILVSLAVNIFTTTILTGSLPISVYIAYGMALSLFIASIGAFGVSALLEKSRSEWESADTPRDPEVIRDFIETGKRMCWIWFFFAVIFIAPIISIFLILVCF